MRRRQRLKSITTKILNNSSSELTAQCSVRVPKVILTLFQFLALRLRKHQTTSVFQHKMMQATVLIRGGEVLTTEPFVADGEEIQLNDKRFGITVNYNSDTQNFTFASGTTGELIAADGALGVSSAQSASSIEASADIASFHD